jgi:hypothetical protein
LSWLAGVVLVVLIPMALPQVVEVVEVFYPLLATQLLLVLVLPLLLAQEAQAALKLTTLVAVKAQILYLI